MDLSAVHHQLHHHFHHQELGCQSDSQTLENMITCSKPTTQQQQQQDPKKPRPPENEPQKCPRCDSTNTKFCYYNNYSLSQPRYFCKSCRRYWTKGGTLRNVPVGGGCRRNKRPSSSSSPSPSFSATSFLKRPHTHDVAGPNHLFSSSSSFGGVLGFGFDHANFTSDFDGFLGHPHNGAGGFLINNNEHQNLGYGFGAPADEMGIVPFEAAAAMKHEGVETRGLWGLYPWQQMISSTNFGDNINHHGLMSSMGFGGLSSGNELEQIRGLIGNSAWQGNLLPSPGLI